MRGLFTLVTYAIALVLAWLVAPGGRHECFWIVLVATAITVFYSAPPFRTKRLGIWANLTIAIPRGVLLKVAGWSAVKTIFGLEPWFIGAIFGLFLLGASTTKDFADMDGDARGGCRTLPIIYGVRRAAWMISPSFVVPFLMIAAGTRLGILTGSPALLYALSVVMTGYGAYVCYLMLRRPEDLAVEENHVSWAHMYRMMFVAQVGFALAYLGSISIFHKLRNDLRFRNDSFVSRFSNLWKIELTPDLRRIKGETARMSEQPLIFDLGKRPPTTRALALQIRSRGEAALDEAQRRADAARYQEVTCRSALNPVKGMPFNWTLNPYRGCTHACHYCFARRYQTQFELGPDDHFSSVILVKINLVDVLRRELDKPSWSREQVAVGTATDPYQPIEGHYKLTRRSLEVLLAGRTPIGLVTKGPMVVRDADLLADLGKRYGCTVYMSVPTVDDEAWRTLEPGTASPLQRLRAVRQLRDAGVNAGVLMAPVVPGFTTQPSKLEATIKAIADHGAAFMGANLMYLKEGTRDHFMGFLASEFPDMVAWYNRLYAGAYVSADYAKAVRAMIDTLQKRYEVRARRPRNEESTPQEPDGPADEEKAAREQAAFDWND